MSGSSHGITKHHFIGCRIGTGGKQDKEIKMLYTPAHIRLDTGKPVSARLVIPILVNLYRKENPDSYRLIAWGALADLFAKNLSQGKEMTFICDGSPYWGNVFYSDGTQVMQKDGRTPLQTRQSSFKIREFTWGAESTRTEQEEIHAGMKSGEGRRPAQWNITGTPDNVLWKQMLAGRGQTFYQGGDKFGYAYVIAPRYAANILLGDQSKILSTYAQAAAPQAGTVLPNVQAPLVNQVQNTFNQPVGTPVPPATGYGLPPVQNQQTGYAGQGTTLPPVQNAAPGLPVYNTAPGLPVYNAPA